MKKQLLTWLVLGLGIAGCGRDPGTAPDPTGDAFTTLRFHITPAGPGAGFEDLSLAADGSLELQLGGGEGSSARGLLAGEKLETLARLLDALPPQDYRPAVACETGTYFVRIDRPSGTRTYASNSCDTEAPVALTDLRQLLSRTAQELHSNRVQVVAHRPLWNGSTSASLATSEFFVRDRDALVRLAARLAPGEAVSLPRIDFAREMVIVAVLAPAAGSRHSLSVPLVERTETGWLRVHLLDEETVGACAADRLEGSFALVAVPRQTGDVLFARESHRVSCE